MRKLRFFAICLLGAMAVSDQAGAQQPSRLKKAAQLIQSYRKASDTLQDAASDRLLAYCVFRQWNAGKPDRNNLKIGSGIVSGARDSIASLSGQERIDQIIVDANGNLGRMNIPVTSTMAGMFTGEIPLDTDTFRVLRQTVEYDKQNREKFENYAVAIEKFASGALVEGSAPLQKIDRINGVHGFAGLQQTVGYVQRDFMKEFNGKKMLNFGKCAGAAERVLDIEKSIQAERDALNAITTQLSLDAAEL